MNKVNIEQGLVPAEKNIFTGDLYYFGDVEHIKIIFDEIYGSEQYKEGLEYIKTLEKPIVVDCGAHIGLASLYFNQASNATIYALEPVKDNFEALCENVKNFPNIHSINIGLRSYSGRSLIDIGDKGTAGGSFFGDRGEKEGVDHLTIEDFMNQNNIDHIDLLKIDTEGSEYEILISKAFKRVEHKIDMIIGESHTQPIYPYAIPYILSNYDTHFTDDKNLTIDVKGTLAGETEPFEVRVFFNSMFVARRKK